MNSQPHTITQHPSSILRGPSVGVGVGVGMGIEGLYLLCSTRSVPVVVIFLHFRALFLAGSLRRPLMRRAKRAVLVG
jgi:hypothetical protein